MVIRLSYGIAAVALTALTTSFPAFALYQDDVHISSDRSLVSEDVNLGYSREIRTLVEHGYPIQSIYLNGIAQGYSIDDIVFMSVIADPSRTDRWVDTAIDMLPSLPTWACREGSESAEDRYAPVVRTEGLEPITPLATLTQKYFEENVRVSPFPEWTNNEVHLRVPTSDLQVLLGDDLWYRHDREDRPVNEGVMISLYRHNQTVVVDGNLGQVQRAVERGDQSVPVVVLYNDELQRPVSEYGEAPVVADIVAAYLGEEIKLTPVPDWRDPYSDFHHAANISEFEEFTTLPPQEEIEESRWAKITTELNAEGFNRQPVIVSMYHNGSRVWIDQRDRLTAARELGIEQAPVVYLYHSIDRLACGVLPGSDCEQRIRTAAESAALRH